MVSIVIAVNVICATEAGEKVFGTILTYVQTNSKNCRLKEQAKKLIFFVNNVSSIDKATQLLESILEKVVVSH